MKAILPSLIVALLLAIPLAYAQQIASSSPSRETSPSNGAALLNQAALAVYRQPSISARISQRVDAHGHQLVGTGMYQQLGSDENRMLRMELKIQVAGRLTSLQQVCDGRFAWVRKDFGGAPELSRIDLRRLRAALEKQSPSQPIDLAKHWIQLGGLPKLLEGLATQFDLKPPRAAKLGKMPVWIVEGAWQAEQRKKLLFDGQEEPLPEEFPDGVIIYLGRDDLFPYRLQYYREPAEIAEPGVAQQRHVLLTTELFEVRLGAPIDPLQFIYKPGDQEVVDHTDQLLKQLGITPEP